MAASVLSPGSMPGSSSSSPYRLPTQLPRSNSRNRSPPLAFEKTPNDSLAPLISPSEGRDLDPFRAMSPLSGAHDSGASHYQAVIEKQADAINALHTAFAAEREAWTFERRQLFQRIGNLERLLRAQNGHSPAKSPIVSPNEGVASPQFRATSTHRLPSIAEDENVRPLSERRPNAPTAIHIPSFESVEELNEGNRNSMLLESAAAQLDELSVSPPLSAKRLSPPPAENRDLAGHTPHKNLVRPPTPPPKDMLLAGIEDTPTRNNTHINTLLTQTKEAEEEEAVLTGPLNMPELPGKPTADNFTEDMLFKKLEKISKDPMSHRPTVFASPSPGLALPDGDDPGAGLSPKTIGSASIENPLAPVSTRDQTILSTASPMANPDETSDAQDGSADERKFEQGGIRLKKKPSSNFGAPFGQLGGFAGLRKLS